MTTTPTDLTILDRLRFHAQATPDRMAYRFLHDSGRSDTLTFGQLDVRARVLAACLRGHASPGDRALLLYPPGLEFVEAFLACLAAGVVAVPAYPPRRNRKSERLRAIADDARPRLVLTTRQTLPVVEASELGALDGLACLATDELRAADGQGDRAEAVAPDQVAFLQYTSGSTGTPRGVVVTHANVMANEAAIQAAFRQTQADVVVSWLPTFHDMGLIGTVLQPLYVGYSAVFMPPATFLREPVRWLRAISEFRGTTAGAPNFAYDHCVQCVSEEQKQGLDLSCWAVAYNGSEPVRAETLDRFEAAFAGCGFRPEAFFPCYGLAEATLFVSGGPPGRQPRRRRLDAAALEAGAAQAVSPPGGRVLVGCGRAGVGTVVVAVDPATRTPVPEGKVGELWVSSPGVAAGYWAPAGEASTVFGNHLACGEGPFLSTGDLGFLADGEVYVTGRSKDLIVVRGRNVYPQDVEAEVERSVGFVRSGGCAAFPLETPFGEGLGLAIEADRQVMRLAEDDPGELRRLADKISASVVRGFDVRLSAFVVVRPGALPRTSSGKVMRFACREGVRGGTLDAIYCWRADAAPVDAQAAGPLWRDR